MKGKCKRVPRFAACLQDLAFQLVSISKTMALPSGCLMTAWENLQEEFEPTEGED